MNHCVPTHTQTAIRLLRLTLWFLPAIFLPAPFILMKIMDGIPVILAFVPFFVVTAAIGYFDIRLIYQWERPGTRPDRARIICWVIGFTLSQILIAPVAIILLVVAMEFVSEGIVSRILHWLP